MYTLFMIQYCPKEQPKTLFALLYALAQQGWASDSREGDPAAHCSRPQAVLPLEVLGSDPGDGLTAVQLRRRETVCLAVSFSAGGSDEEENAGKERDTPASH